MFSVNRLSVIIYMVLTSKDRQRIMVIWSKCYDVQHIWYFSVCLFFFCNCKIAKKIVLCSVPVYREIDSAAGLLLTSRTRCVHLQPEILNFQRERNIVIAELVHLK